MGAQFAEAPTPGDLVSMSDAVKKANLGVEQAGLRAWTFWHGADCRDMSGERGFLYPVNASDCQRWVKAWACDGFDCKTVEQDVCAMFKCMTEVL